MQSVSLEKNKYVTASTVELDGFGEREGGTRGEGGGGVLSPPAGPGGEAPGKFGVHDP